MEYDNSMIANNTMINNASNSSKNDSTTPSRSEIRSNDQSNSSMSITKNKTKPKPVKGQKLKIICKNDSKIKFDSNCEELTIHIITCDDCLKELLLYQARQEKLETQLLNDKKDKKKKRKKELILIIPWK